MSVQSTIVSRLGARFAPLHLEVVNESHMHSVPPGSESHFKVTLVSEAFAGRRLVEQARHEAAPHHGRSVPCGPARIRAPDGLRHGFYVLNEVFAQA